MIGGGWRGSPTTGCELVESCATGSRAVDIAGRLIGDRREGVAQAGPIPAALTPRAPPLAPTDAPRHTDDRAARGDACTNYPLVWTGRGRWSVSASMTMCAPPMRAAFTPSGWRRHGDAMPSRR